MSYFRGKITNLGLQLDFLVTALHSLGTYYGLDWVALITGISGSYLITNRNRWGFFISGAGCVAGFTVAFTAGQFGFVAYNIIIVAMMIRGFLLWGPPFQGHLEAAE
jgi:hypothetical protein